MAHPQMMIVSVPYSLGAFLGRQLERMQTAAGLAFQCPIRWARSWGAFRPRSFRTPLKRVSVPYSLGAFLGLRFRWNERDEARSFSALFVGRVLGAQVLGISATVVVRFSALFVGRVLGADVQDLMSEWTEGFSALFVGRVLGASPHGNRAG